MTKDILISITGMQTLDTGEAVEVINTGTYYKKNDTHYVLFEEVYEGFYETTKNRIKFRPGFLQVTKKGVMNTNMEYDIKNQTYCMYATPYGEIMLGIRTTKLELEEGKDEIVLHAHYALDAQNQFLANCQIKIVIKPLGQGA